MKSNTRMHQLSGCWCTGRMYVLVSQGNWNMLRSTFSNLSPRYLVRLWKQCSSLHCSYTLTWDLNSFLPHTVVLHHVQFCWSSMIHMVADCCLTFKASRRNISHCRSIFWGDGAEIIGSGKVKATALPAEYMSCKQRAPAWQLYVSDWSWAAAFVCCLAKHAGKCSRHLPELPCDSEMQAATVYQISLRWYTSAAAPR